MGKSAGDYETFGSWSGQQDAKAEEQKRKAKERHEKWIKDNHVKPMSANEWYSFQKVGPYEISGLCLQSYPCQHYVKLTPTTCEILNGRDIYHLLRSQGISEKHFECYKPNESDHPAEIQTDMYNHTVTENGNKLSLCRKIYSKIKYFLGRWCGW